MEQSGTAGLTVSVCETTPYNDQKPGTSGLRKKVSVFQQPNYLANFVQAIFCSLPRERLEGCTLLVSGDGRYFSDTAIYTIAEIAAGNGVGRLWVGVHGLVSTPAASAIIRERENGCCYGGILLTASHNPGGPDGDFGVKFNTDNGGPAPEIVTDKIYALSKTLTQIKKATLPQFSYDKPQVHHFGQNFSIEIIDPIEDWLGVIQRIFDVPLLKALVASPEAGKPPRCRIVYDALNGVAGPYAKRILHEVLGAPLDCLMHCDPKTDFGGLHPDPNLTYASELVKCMGLNSDGTPIATEGKTTTSLLLQRRTHRV